MCCSSTAATGPLHASTPSSKRLAVTHIGVCGDDAVIMIMLLRVTSGTNPTMYLNKDSTCEFEFGRAYHMRHFSCQICDANLTQLDSFVPRGRKPYCFLCFGAHFADKCAACRTPINPMPGHGGKVSVGGKHWHGSCFECKSCSTRLDCKPCIPRSDVIYCKPCLKKNNERGEAREKSNRLAS